MDELTVAKICRCRLRGDAQRWICFLDDDLTGLQDIGVPQITTEQKMELLARVDKARIALDKYTEAVIQCAVLEGKEDYDPDDEYMVELDELEYDLDQLKYEIQFLKPRDEEEKSAMVRAEANAHEEPGNMGHVVAKPPPPMEEGITIEGTLSSTWEDYYQEMFGVVEHVLDIGPNSTKKLDDRLLTVIMVGLSDRETWKELLARVKTLELEEANGAMRRHEDPAWTWMVKLFSRSVVVTVFDRGKSSREDTRGSPRSFRHDQI